MTSTRESAVGLQHQRTAIDVAMAALSPIIGQEFLDRHNLRDPFNRTSSRRQPASPRSAPAPGSSRRCRVSASRRPG
jgi:hypothetical protein